MFGFGKKSTGDRCAAIIDIGSGSVGIALIHSKEAEEKPTVIWTHREYVLLRDIKNLSDSLKSINTALVNAFLELGNTGLSELRTYDKSLRVEYVQTSISAPWAYTITRTVHYTSEKPFQISSNLIQQLTEAAQNQALHAVKELGLSIQGLELITDATVNLTLNGYTIPHPSTQKGKSLSLSNISAITQRSILSTLEDSLQKILPKTENSSYSFMFLYYCMLRNLHPDTAEVCLIDITSEATEIGIIREGVLEHVTHAPYGTFTLAREISAACNIPKEEAYTYLKGGESFVQTKLSPENQANLTKVLDAYDKKISELFTQTGDALSIPKTLFLHCDVHTEPFFSEHIKKASSLTTQSLHSIRLVTSKLVGEDQVSDSALMFSAHFFHIHAHCDIPFKD